MIKTEMMDNGRLIRYYSDDGHDLQQVDTGVVYREAVDVYPSAHTYVEVERIADEDEDEAFQGLDADKIAELAVEEALDILTGEVEA